MSGAISAHVSAASPELIDGMNKVSLHAEKMIYLSGTLQHIMPAKSVHNAS